MFDQQRNASLLASPSPDGTLRAVYIMEKGRHAALGSARAYEEALRRSFPFFLEVRCRGCGRVWVGVVVVVVVVVAVGVGGGWVGGWVGG